MKIRSFKKEAKRQLEGQWSVSAMVTLVFAVIYVVLPMIVEIQLSGGYENWIYTTGNENGQSFSTFLITLVLLPLSIGYSWMFLSVIRTGERVRFSGLFQAFSEISMYLKLLGTYLLMMIYVVLWSLLFIIPGIIKAFAYSQTFFVYKDNPKMGINAAITESRKLMVGYKWKFFVLQLSFIGWVFVGLITFGIGFLWIYPYMTATYASFYNDLVEKKKSAEPIDHDENGKDE